MVPTWYPITYQSHNGPLYHGTSRLYLLHHKIALNHSFPMVLLSLNLAKLLWSYNQIITWYLHGTHMVPMGKWVFLHQFWSAKYEINSNHSNMLDSAGIQPTFSWQLLFLVEDTQLYCAHVVALSQLSQFLCYSLWHLGQILHGCGKAVPVVTWLMWRCHHHGKGIKYLGQSSHDHSRGVMVVFLWQQCLNG